MGEYKVVVFLPVDLINKKILFKPSRTDRVDRTLIRHDPDKIAKVVLTASELQNGLEFLKKK